MLNNQVLQGAIAALLLVIVVFLAIDYRGPHTMADNVHAAMQDLKR
jgi:hypothetical protein